MKVVLATKNPGKIREFQQLCGETPWLELVPAPPEFDPAETGTSFRDNAIIKAQAAALATGMLSAADDSGLEVNALGGRPGVYSSRYSQGDEKLGRDKLLSELAGVPAERRQAAYICYMVLASPGGEILFESQGIWRGCIGFAESGSNGFGFDPIFYLPEHAANVADLSSDKKNELSHRAQAWRAVVAFLETIERSKTVFSGEQVER
jgi:XTP/dITP diphosphohydrolase